MHFILRQKSPLPRAQRILKTLLVRYSEQASGTPSPLMSTTVETRPQTAPPASRERTGPNPFTRRKVVGYLITLLTWVLVFLFFFVGL